ILTKGVFIEGTSIIAREKEIELRNKGLNEDFIKKCKDYLYEPGISVFKDASLANKNFLIKSFHDVTEGGLFTAIAEMAIASNTGVLIEIDKINVLSESLKLSELYDLNPYNTISSGSLLIAVKENNSYDLINLLKKNKISAEKIGNFTLRNKGLKIQDTNKNISRLEYSEIDDITKIFN
ncbi:MAG: AIR synthase-related protein, partial [Candidatus Hermodarchaeota archaeon]